MPPARLLLLPCIILLAQARPAGGQVPGPVRLSGYVRSAATGEVIRSAQVAAEGQTARVETNQDGFYVLSLAPGRHVIRIRAVGYRARSDTLAIALPLFRDFLLSPSPFELEQLAVTAARTGSDVDPRVPEMSTARLDSKTIQLTPVVLGEADPIRTLTLLPGVKTVSDFSTGFSVRGGSPDQNLILLDESTIYNPAHVFGFFSVFNADAVDDVKLYKAALPARLGGRLSSVLDIRQREGNANAFAGSAAVGLLASRMLLEGPLPGALGSFLVAGRRTYADLFLKLSSNPEINRNTAYFYDLNLKANVRLGSTGTLLLSGYFGRDRFAIAERFGARWGNAAGSFRWNQVFGNRLFSKVALTVSDYDYGLEFLGSGRDLAWTSRIRGAELRVNQTLHLGNRNILEFGGELARHTIEPGRIRPVGDSPINPIDFQPRRGLAPALHLSHEIALGSRLSLRYGARLAGFRRIGPATIYRYGPEGPVVYNAELGRHERGTVLDSVRYGDGRRLIRSFTGLEPRVAVRLGLTPGSSLKLSYARTRQYLHLVSNTNSPTPVDIWEPVGPYLEPQRADQVAAGYAATAGGEAWELSAEAYYKWLANLTDFIDGADLALNDRLETEMLQGSGRAYGLELYARKRTGKLTGWISYTWSRAERRLAGVSAADPGVNGGRYYPSPYDKTHDLSVVGFHPLSRRWTLGGTFVLASGLPATYPVSRYRYGGLAVVEYGARNSARLPAYHRLDLTATRSWGGKQLQVGLYNLYNRFNAQSIAFQQQERNPLLVEAVQTAIFGIVPGVSFSFRF